MDVRELVELLIGTEVDPTARDLGDPNTEIRTDRDRARRFAFLSTDLVVLDAPEIQSIEALEEILDPDIPIEGDGANEPAPVRDGVLLTKTIPSRIEDRSHGDQNCGGHDFPISRQAHSERDEVVTQTNDL